MLRPLRVSQPTTVTEASAELARLGEEAKVYAGGTELILLLRLGLVHSAHLVDVKKIPALGELAWDGTMMHIGAAVTHRRLERSADIAEHLSLLHQAASLVANVRVRNVGTLGGNLCFGDPHSDPAPALLVYNTRVTIGHHSGTRSLGLDAFFVGVYETALAPDELLVAVEVEPLPQGVGSAYLRCARVERPSLAVAVAAAQRDGRLAQVRLAVSCIGPGSPCACMSSKRALRAQRSLRASSSSGRPSATIRRSCNRSMICMDRRHIKRISQGCSSAAP
jgi:aerobic carbon-monoxide dehydrogenase medium subunit